MSHRRRSTADSAHTSLPQYPWLQGLARLFLHHPFIHPLLCNETEDTCQSAHWCKNTWAWFRSDARCHVSLIEVVKKLDCLWIAGCKRTSNVSVKASEDGRVQGGDWSRNTKSVSSWKILYLSINVFTTLRSKSSEGYHSSFQAKSALLYSSCKIVTLMLTFFSIAQ